MRNHAIDFLGIGAPRCGTTWLHKRLAEHTDFGLLPKKELHYFDRSLVYPSPSFLSETKLMKRVLDGRWTKQALKECLSQLKDLNYAQFRWKCKWYFSNYDDNWYLSLFDGLSGITGEITPAYAILTENDVELISKLLPNARLVFLIRNPIDRAWSSYRRNVDRNNLLDGGDDAIIEFLQSPGQISRTNYLGTLDRYHKFFDAERIVVGFYDAIVDQPRELLSEIVKFLGGAVEKIDTDCRLTEKENASTQTSISSGVMEFLVEQNRPLLEGLAERFDGYCGGWLHGRRGASSEKRNLPPPVMFGDGSRVS